MDFNIIRINVLEFTCCLVFLNDKKQYRKLFITILFFGRAYDSASLINLRDSLY